MECTFHKITGIEWQKELNVASHYTRLSHEKLNKNKFKTKMCIQDICFAKGHLQLIQLLVEALCF